MPNPAYPCSRLQYKPQLLCHSCLSTTGLRTATQGRGQPAVWHTSTEPPAGMWAAGMGLGGLQVSASSQPPQYWERPIPSHGTGR